MAEDFSNELSLLQEYNQWVSARNIAAKDISPDEFMRDRIKEVAFNRLEEALEYIDTAADRKWAVIRAILDGTDLPEEVMAEAVEDAVVVMEEIIYDEPTG